APGHILHRQVPNHSKRPRPLSSPLVEPDDVRMPQLGRLGNAAQKAADLFLVELEVAWVDAEGHNGPARFHRPDGTIPVAVAAGVDSVLAHEFHRRTRTRCFKGYPKPVRTELQHVSVLESPRLLQADAIDLDPAAAVQVEKPPGAADTRQEGVLGRGL